MILGGIDSPCTLVVTSSCRVFYRQWSTKRWFKWTRTVLEPVYVCENVLSVVSFRAFRHTHWQFDLQYCFLRTEETDPVMPQPIHKQSVTIG
jgi:hypothetical protein